MSNRNDNVCEDEWTEIQQRFEKEGLDFETLGAEERLLHVWRWLVDAESNLRSSRKMLDKLRDLQHEEMEEMESYIGHIRELAEERAGQLESEAIVLRSKLESSHQQAATIAALLEQNGFQTGDAEESLGEQVAFLIADRAKLLEEMDVLKKLKLSNGVNGINKEGDLLSEIIKVSSEKEVLRREVSEMCERVQLLEKASRQLELDNERLAFKLSEALAELEERETQLRQLANSEEPSVQSVNILWPGFRRGDSSRSSSRRSSFQRGESPRSSLKRASSPRSSSRKSHGEPLRAFQHSFMSSTRSSSKSPPQEKEFSQEMKEICTQTDSYHINVDGLLSPGYREGESKSPCGDSALPSLFSDSSCASPKKLASLLDSQIAASRSELLRLEEIKKLQAEAENLKGQLNAMNEKYNTLAMKHMQYKNKRKSQVDDLRNRLDVELSSLQCEVENLQSKLALQKKMLKSEESFRKRVETDYRRLQEEKRKLMVSVMNFEAVMKDKEREMTLLQKKVAVLEDTNSSLLAKVLELKYATRHGLEVGRSSTDNQSTSQELARTDSDKDSKL